MKKIVLFTITITMFIFSCGTAKIFVKELQTVSSIGKLVGGQCTLESADRLSSIYKTQKNIMEGIVKAKKTARTFGKEFKIDKKKFCKAKKILNDIEWNWVLDGGQITFEEAVTLGPGTWYYDSIKKFGCKNGKYSAILKVRDKISQFQKELTAFMKKEGKICR